MTYQFVFAWPLLPVMVMVLVLMLIVMIMRKKHHHYVMMPLMAWLRSDEGT